MGTPSKAEVGRVSTTYRSMTPGTGDAFNGGTAWQGNLSVEVHAEDALPLSLRIQSADDRPGTAIIMCMNEDETLALIGHLLRGRALVKDAKEEAGANG